MLFIRQTGRSLKSWKSNIACFKQFRWCTVVGLHWCNTAMTTYTCTLQCNCSKNALCRKSDMMGYKNIMWQLPLKYFQPFACNSGERNFKDQNSKAKFDQHVAVGRSWCQTLIVAICVRKHQDSDLHSAMLHALSAFHCVYLALTTSNSWHFPLIHQKQIHFCARPWTMNNHADVQANK